MFIRAAGISSRHKQSLFREALTGHINSLELGESVLFTILDWITDNLPGFLETAQDEGWLIQCDSMFSLKSI